MTTDVLPPETTFGFVADQVLRAVADTPSDPDRLPDGEPIRGKVIFTPLLSLRRNGATLWVDPVIATVHQGAKEPDDNDASKAGLLIDPAGVVGSVGLVTGTWKVEYDLIGLYPQKDRMKPFLFTVTEQHTEVDPLLLWEVGPSPAPPTDEHSLRASIRAAIDARRGVAGGLAALDGVTGNVLDADGNEVSGVRSGLGLTMDAALSSGLSFAVGVVGDSTGNDTTEWPYLLGQALAANHPDKTVQWRAWSDSNQAFTTVETIQTGSDGARHLDVTPGEYTRNLPAANSQHLSGVIDVRVKLSLTDWTPTGQANILGKTGLAGDRGWYLGINNGVSGSRPIFLYSTDGTALDVMTIVGKPTVSDGDDIWMRWVFTPDDGNGNRTLAAYQSPDGGVWTQIGGTTTTPGAVSVHDNSTVGYALGGQGSGAAFDGKVYEVQVRDGLNGPSIVPALPDLWSLNAYRPGETSPVGGSPVITVVNASHAGADLGYWNAAERVRRASIGYGQVLTFLSLSHNQGVDTGRAFTEPYDALRSAVEDETDAPVVILTQNPQRPALGASAAHATRRLNLMAYARMRGIDIIDTYGVFTERSDWQSALMADDAHPNEAGSQLWAEKVIAALGL